MPLERGSTALKKLNSVCVCVLVDSSIPVPRMAFYLTLLIPYIVVHAATVGVVGSALLYTYILYVGFQCIIYIRFHCFES